MSYLEKTIKENIQDLCDILIEEINEDRIGSPEYVAAKDFIFFSVRYLDRIKEAKDSG